MYDRMESYVTANGGKIHLRTPVGRVLTTGGRVCGLELDDGTIVNAEHVVSSMPLTMLVLTLSGADKEVIDAAKSLGFRNTILVYLKVANEDLFPDNWIYVHSPSLRVGRITNYRNWSPYLYGDEKSTILALEYWCGEDDELWTLEDRKLIELGKEELCEAGLAVKREIEDGHIHRIHRCYPVYRKGYKKLLAPIIHYINGLEGLTVIGRYGSFKYNNQDHSILMGILAAENIAYGAENDLWAVNTDYEYHESALISDTGLVAANFERFM